MPIKLHYVTSLMPFDCESVSLCGQGTDNVTCSHMKDCYSMTLTPMISMMSYIEFPKSRWDRVQDDCRCSLGPADIIHTPIIATRVTHE